MYQVVTKFHEKEVLALHRLTSLLVFLFIASIGLSAEDANV